MRKIRQRLAVAVLLAGTVAACSSQPARDAPAPGPPNFLAGCGPLSDQVIAAAGRVPDVRQQGAPPSCIWTGSDPTGAAVEVTYAWLPNDTLAQEVQIAGQQGYGTEKFVENKFAGFYWHDPRDPGSCGASAADSGVVTWWVHNRSHTGLPADPCPAALTLMRQTLLIDGT